MDWLSSFDPAAARQSARVERSKRHDRSKPAEWLLHLLGECSSWAHQFLAPTPSSQPNTVVGTTRLHQPPPSAGSSSSAIRPPRSPHRIKALILRRHCGVKTPQPKRKTKFRTKPWEISASPNHRPWPGQARKEVPPPRPTSSRSAPPVQFILGQYYTTTRIHAASTSANKRRILHLYRNARHLCRSEPGPSVPRGPKAKRLSL